MKHPVDVHVGRRIRQARWHAGKTQKQLAASLNISFQQLQKYETAGNRVSASRLTEVADELGVPVTYFFDGLQKKNTGKKRKATLSETLNDREAVELMRMYQNTPEKLRKQIFELTAALATKNPA
nr:helix-turn-helix transcriptional regulator [uncultured Aliiroseovarius sp.]